jgi:hypothetical protein
MFENMMIGSVIISNVIQVKDFIHFGKLDRLLCTRPGVKPGDHSIFVDENYAEHVCVIKRVVGEIETKKDYCKAYDVVVIHDGKDTKAFCIYFGSLSRVCIKKDHVYEKFDDII